MLHYGTHLVLFADARVYINCISGVVMKEADLL